MIYQEVDLSACRQIEIKGKSLSIGKSINADDKGRRAKVLQLASSGGNLIELESAVDNSQCLDYPRVFLIFSESVGDNMVVLGGRIVYWLDTISMRAYKSYVLEREDQDVEYWENEILPVEFGYLIVYEAGVFLIDGQLDLVWHRSKSYNDKVELSDQSTMKIISDDEQFKFYSLTDGEQTSMV